MHCKHCLQDKSADGFYKCSPSKCKDCIKSYARQHRLENLERVRAYDRMRASQPHRMANNFSHSQGWREKFPNRRRAQGAVQHALRSGKLVKQPCMVCGEKAVAHHPDYDRPLDVVWLCQPHHKQAHALV